MVRNLLDKIPLYKSHTRSGREFTRNVKLKKDDMQIEEYNVRFACQTHSKFALDAAAMDAFDQPSTKPFHPKSPL